MNLGLNAKDAETINRLIDEYKANKEGKNPFELLCEFLDIMTLADVFRIIPTK